MVHQRNGAEDALGKADDPSRTLLRLVLDVVAILDADGTLRYVSPGVEAMLGYTPEEVTGTEVFDYVHPDDLERALGALAETLVTSGVLPPVEFRASRADGSWRHVEVVRNNRLDDPAVGGVVINVRDVTGRKEAEERLKETERRLSTLLSSTPAMVYRCLNEPDWPEEYVSDYAIELTGYPAAAFMGNPTLFGSLITERDKQRIWDEVQEAVGKRERFRLHYAIHHRDGSLRFVEELGQGVYDEFGGVVAVEGLIYDVTQRKRAEEALKEAEERYRTLVERIPAIVYVQEVDEPSRTTYVSPQNEAVLGYTPEECLADPDHWIKIMHPEDRERVLAEDGRTNETGDTFRMEYRQFAKDRRVVWLRDESTLVRGEGGEPLYWLGVQTDVTERKAAEERLRESEERFRRSFDDAAIGMALVAPDGRWLQVNRSLCEMIGYPEEELREKTFQDITHPDDLGADIELVRQMLAGEIQTYQMEKRYLHKDSHVLWILLSVSLVRDAEGEPLYFVSQIQDITERKAAEAALREAEARYRTLVERIPAVTFVDRAVGPKSPIYVSPQVEGMLGYTPEEWMEGRLWRERLHPEDRRRVLASDERFEADGEAVDEEYRLLAKDGSVVWVREEAVSVRWEGGESLYVQGILSDVTERKALEQQLEHRAFHDSLTNLPNRQLFVDRLGQALRRTRRSKKRGVAVLFMDLDGFKVVNDSLGHEAGDSLLVAVAERLRGCLRPEDTLARFGGDEFVVLLEDAAGPDEPVRVAERIIDELGGPFTIEGRELYVRVSIGIALGEDRTKGPDDLLRDADTAMYRAKDEDSGYAVFDSAMYERVIVRLQSENDLKRAIEREEFVVHYQPIVNLRTGEVSAVEALVRWEHPKWGLLNPDEFVPIAEESGLVIPMGEQVLREACLKANEWQEENPRTPPLVMSVNLSAGQLSRPGLAETVEAILQETGLEGSRLTLDVTETVYVKTLEVNNTVLDRLRSLGLRFSIDDFGIGYSSLSYLKRLPADALKIDKSFVRGLGEDAEDKAIIRMIIELAHTLGLEVIAEGVETREQAALLADMGCHFGQGFYFSKPLPPEDLSKHLARA